MWDVCSANRKRTRAPTSSINLSLEFICGRGGASLASLFSLGLLLIDFHPKLRLRGEWNIPTSLPLLCVCFFFSLTSLNFNMKTTSSHRVGPLHKRVVYVKEIGTLSKG